MNYIRLHKIARDDIDRMINKTPARKHRVMQRVLFVKIVGTDNRRFQRTGEYNTSDYRIVERE